MDRCADRGWELLGNGSLIRKAEEAGYDVMVTTGQNMRYQRDLTGSNLGFVVLMSTAWPRVRHQTTEIRAAIKEVRPGEVREVPT